MGELLKNGQVTKRKAAEETELKTFRTLPSFRLHVLSRLSERWHEQVYRKQFGLKLFECRVIGITGGYGQVSFKRLCQEANLEKSYASRLINRLTKRGLIQKVGNPTDQRAIMLGLTKAGRETHRALHATAVELNERWLSVLSPEQRRVFTTCLVVLIEQIRVLSEEDRDSRRRKQKDTGGARRNAAQVLGEVVVDEKMARQLYQLLSAALGEGRK
jgi:DNA-binding MarR family transcriptional regulator